MIRAFRDFQGYPEKWDFKATRGARVSRGHQDCVERQDLWGNQVTKDFPGFQVLQVQRAFQGTLDLQDKTDRKD